MPITVSFEIEWSERQLVNENVKERTQIYKIQNIKTNIINKENYIRDQIFRYNEGRISRLEFVKFLSYKRNPIL